MALIRHAIEKDLRQLLIEHKYNKKDDEQLITEYLNLILSRFTTPIDTVFQIMIGLYDNNAEELEKNLAKVKLLNKSISNKDKLLALNVLQYYSTTIAKPKDIIERIEENKKLNAFDDVDYDISILPFK